VRAVPDGPLQLPESARALHWADGLTVTDAEPLVTYDHPHFGRWPAVTTRRHGTGRVTYVGTVPGRDLARELAAWLAPAARSGTNRGLLSSRDDNRPRRLRCVTSTAAAYASALALGLASGFTPRSPWSTDRPCSNSPSASAWSTGLLRMPLKKISQ